MPPPFRFLFEKRKKKPLMRFRINRKSVYWTHVLLTACSLSLLATLPPRSGFSSAPLGPKDQGERLGSP